MSIGIKLPYIGHMSDEAYFAFPAMDQTGLKNWMISPAEYESRKHSKPTRGMRTGIAAHAFVLGTPKPRENTNGYTFGDTFIDKDEASNAFQMSLISHDILCKDPGKAEVTMIAPDPWADVLIKGKADWLPDKPGEDGVYRIWDYKTTHSLDSFQKQFVAGGYDIQAAMYLRLYKYTHPDEKRPLGFAWFVQETRSPYDYQIYTAEDNDDDMLVQAQKLITLTLKDYKQWKDAHPLKLDLQDVRIAGRDHHPHAIALDAAGDWLRRNQMSRMENRVKEYEEKKNDRNE